MQILQVVVVYIDLIIHLSIALIHQKMVKLIYGYVIMRMQIKWIVYLMMKRTSNQNVMIIMLIIQVLIFCAALSVAQYVYHG